MEIFIKTVLILEKTAEEMARKKFIKLRSNSIQIARNEQCGGTHFTEEPRLSAAVTVLDLVYTSKVVEIKPSL